MKKNILALATVFAFLSFNANAGVIAVLDVEKIVKDSTAMRDIQKKVSKKQEEYQKDVDKRQKELESEKTKLDGKKNVLSADAFEKEAKKFEEKVDVLKDVVDKKQNSLKKASIDGMGKVNEAIKEVIASISKEKDFDLIVPAGQVLFYKDGLDISNEVLEKLNAKITKVDIKFE
jgi:outer membrane protein